jgi:hypothetical protein
MVLASVAMVFKVRVVTFLHVLTVVHTMGNVTKECVDAM